MSSSTPGATTQTWVDIPAAANRLTIEIIARAGFGYSFGELGAHEDNPFLDAVLRELEFAIRKPTQSRSTRRCSAEVAKRLHYADKRYIREWVAGVIASRGAIRA